MVQAKKSKVTCYECNTCYSIDLARLAADVTAFKCQKCGARVPILRRILKPKVDGGGQVKSSGAEPSSAPAPSSGYQAYLADELSWELASEPEESGGGDWLATYADMMSILLIFFILMFAISTVDKKKYETVMGSINAALGGNLVLPAPTEPLPAPAVLPKPADILDRLRQSVKHEESSLAALREQLERFIAEENLRNRFTIFDEEDGLKLVAQDAVMFDSGSADIRDEVKENLRKIGRILKSIEYRIIVEGHTDDRPIRTARYSSNWELSVARATNVIHFLVAECALEPTRLSASGYAYYRPRYDSNSADREKNRRIEVVVKKKYGSDLTDELLGSK